MKIAISNIAWEQQEEKNIISLLKKYNIKGVEIAPTKIWNDPTGIKDNVFTEYKKLWAKKGISIVAMQSILYGHQELTIFENKDTREKTITYISRMIHITSLLGIRVMVFGSPKNRVINGLTSANVLEIACQFFSKIAGFAKQHDVYFCIEPNPASYGTNFVNNTKEAIALIKAVNHPYFRLHLDAGALTLNNENYEESIKKGFPYLSHFHISQPYLTPVGKGVVNHKKIAKILKDLHYDKWVSIEMLNTNTKKSVDIIDKTLAFITSIYK